MTASGSSPKTRSQGLIVVLAVATIITAIGFLFYFNVISVTDAGKDPSVTALVGGRSGGDILRVGPYAVWADEAHYEGTPPREAAKDCHAKNESLTITQPVLPIHLSPTGEWLCLSEGQSVELDSGRVTVLLNQINAKNPPDNTRDAPPLSSLTVTTQRSGSEKWAAALPALLLALGPAALVSSVFALFERR
jgi:hypothetical protein